MKHPPYHLRVNKAVDRLAFIDAIKRLEKLGIPLSEYTYYGFGGPYLEDFRLIYELCPEIKMISVEKDAGTFKRQGFHRPCGESKLELVRDRFESFLARYTPNDERSIFWLDYNDLEFRDFDEFMALLSKLTKGSMLKITLPAEPSDYFDESPANSESGADIFRKEFGEVMPDSTSDPPRGPYAFACYLQDMLRVAAERALPSAFPVLFHPVSSFHYSDGTSIYTLTGVVWSRKLEREVKTAYKGWEFANLNWTKPKEIDLPDLSTKERLYLQQHLPCRANAGRELRRKLGYNIDEDWRLTVYKLRQYAKFHRYSPYFVKAIP